MKERIIYAPGVNESELLRNLAIHNVNCINVRICGTSKLAQTALVRSNIVLKEQMLDIREENAVVAVAVKDEEYFGEVSYADVQEIAMAIRRMRSLVVRPDESVTLKDILAKGQFEEKNTALYNVYEKYMRILEKRNALDRLGMVKKAIAEAKPWDAEWIILEEYPLNPVEMALVDKVSGGEYKQISICELYNLQNTNLHIESYKNCYGAPNEVETVLQDIYQSESKDSKVKKADECVVALTDIATYSQLFFDYALLHRIPVTFGCGIPIVNSNPAKLLSSYYHWMTDGFFSEESLKRLLNSVAFNSSKLYEQFPESEEKVNRIKLYSYAGEMRLTNNASINEERLHTYREVLVQNEQIATEGTAEYEKVQQAKKYVPLLEILSKELELPVEEFIAKYAYIRKDSSNCATELLMKLDQAAVVAIYEELSVIQKSGYAENVEGIIEAVLRKNICKQSSAGGALHITDIKSALSCVRENLYVIGLAATKFPGAPRENYLLLDDDLRCFGEGASSQLSFARVAKKKEDLFALLRMASNCGAKIYLSYAGLNVSELKKNNASSVLYEVYCEEKGEAATMEAFAETVVSVGYFAPAISANREVGKVYSIGDEIETPILKEIETKTVSMEADKEYSPSAIATFFECPHKYMFRYILGMQEPEEENVFEVLSPRDRGALAHSIMAATVNRDITVEEFIRISGEYFDRMITQKPPVIKDNIQQARTVFLDMMRVAYRMRPQGEVICREEDIHCRHESGILIHGIPDCVEKMTDGTYRIIDYKTGNTVHHIQNDIDSCMQVILYAYLMETEGYNVTVGEFRYFNVGEVITCRYDADMKNKLKSKLAHFKECVENGDFGKMSYREKPKNNFLPRPSVNPACEYCKYAAICDEK